MLNLLFINQKIRLMKKILFSIISVFLFFSLGAAPVSKKQAEVVAKNYFMYRTGQKSLSVESVDVYKYKNHACMYIYSFKEGGFVIVASDDAVRPILGYSTESKYNKKVKNPVFSAWLDNYAKEIDYIVSSKMDNSQTKRMWDNIIAGNFSKSTKAVSPLLTSIWGQDGGYDDYCPSGTPVGCVATAMAQIMNYYEYPTQGVYQHSYTHPTYGLQSANFGETTYNWSNMPDNSATDDIALLMYHCGVAVDMNYATDGSGAMTMDVPYVLANYFQYDQSVLYVQKEAYSDTDWKNLLKAQLDASHPVLYSGSSTSSGGHAFVCDGYNDSDEFHFNWGWDGYADGYYAIGSLNPAGQDFNSDNAAVINIFPASTPTFLAVKKFSGYPELSTRMDYISAPNDYVAWGIGGEGTGNGTYYRVYTKTTDGGLTWSAKEITDMGGTSFSMIYGLDADNAYIAMWGNDQANNKILKTTDGGNTWTEVLSGGHSASFFNVVHFFNQNEGFVQGDPDSEFELYTTTDAGQNWIRVPGDDIPDPLSGEYGIVGHYTAVGDSIWFTTNKGRIYRSFDKGYTWQVTTMYSGSNDTYIEVAFDGQGNGLAIVTLISGNNVVGHEFYRSTDAGATWTQITPIGMHYGSISSVRGESQTFVTTGIDFRNNDYGIAITYDNGNTWEQLAGYYSIIQMGAVDFPSSLKGYIGSFSSDYSDGVWVYGYSSPLVADFAVDSLGCIDSVLVFTSIASGDIDTYEWNFGADATPATATGVGPHTVVYSTAGNKTVTLRVSNSGTYNEKSKNILVADVAPQVDTILGPIHVQAGETHLYSASPADFENTLYQWSYTNSLWTGESDSASIEMTFTGFEIPGDLMLKTFNGCGVDYDTIHIDYATLLDVETAAFSILPNPAYDFLNISASETIQTIEIVTLNGQVVMTSNINAKEGRINISDIPQGVYVVRIATNNGISTSKLVIQ